MIPIFNTVKVLNGLIKYKVKSQFLFGIVCWQIVPNVISRFPVYFVLLVQTWKAASEKKSPWICKKFVPFQIYVKLQKADKWIVNFLVAVDSMSLLLPCFYYYKKSSCILSLVHIHNCSIQVLSCCWMLLISKAAVLMIKWKNIKKRFGTNGGWWIHCVRSHSPPISF